MTTSEGKDLLTKVQRYETALTEMRAAHADIKDVVFEHILFDRWQRLGTDLGFPTAARPHDVQRHGDPAPVTPLIPEMSESWAG